MGPLLEQTLLLFLALPAHDPHHVEEGALLGCQPLAGHQVGELQVNLVRHRQPFHPLRNYCVFNVLFENFT